MSNKNRKFNVPVFAVFFLSVLLSVTGCAGFGNSEESNAVNAKKLAITEIVTSNKDSLVDPDVGSPDWFEIHNPTETDVDISGFGISDNMRNFHKYVFPKGTRVPAGGYLIVYAGENNGLNSTNVPCTGFGLSKGGEHLFFTDAYYELLQQVQVPALQTDISYAMRQDGSYGYCGEPTPGKDNDDSKIVSDINDIKIVKDYSKLVISEVMPGSAEEGPWVELYNTSDTIVRADDYYLSDSDADLLKYKLPKVTVEPHGYLVIYLGDKQDGSVEPEASFKLGKKDTSLYLSGDNGVLVNQLSWDRGLPEGVAVVSDKPKKYTSEPTRGKANSDEVFDTIQTFCEIDAADPLIVNEVLQSNKYSIIDCDGDRSDWVEIFNRSDRDVSLKEYFLSDDEKNLLKYQLPDIVIPANGYVIVFLSGKDKAVGSEYHSNFRLGAGETKLYLTRLSNMHTDSMPLMEKKKSNVSIGRDETGSVVYYAQPTPGTKNTSKAFEKAEDIGFFNKDGVYVSEVCATHALGKKENDWIELYNGGTTAVDLSGWHLSDSASEEPKWTFPSGSIIAPGGYFVQECTSHTIRLNDKTAYMGISSSGETIYLTNDANETIDIFETGVLTGSITSGRSEGDSEGHRVFFAKATKGKKNSEEIMVGYAPTPIFSETALYHTSPFTVAIMVSDPSAVVYYTTNGEEPTRNSDLYTGPINISENTTLRAIAYADGRRRSPIVTGTYLFDEPHTIPVVCVAMSPEDYNKITGSATKSNKPERKAYVSYYEKDGSLGISFPCGMKAKGQGTLGYKQKSFSLTLRGAYGQTKVTYPFFENCEFDTFSALVIRNSGQDIEEARMRDSLFSRLMKGMNLDYEETRPCAVYINGRYWGLYDFNEKLSSAYLETHTGVSSDYVDYVQRNETTIKGSNKGYLEARAWGRNKNLQDDAVFAQYAEMVDVAYCTDYIIAQTFIINSDMFNQKFWHTKDNTVKWRPVFFDLDWGLNEKSSVKRSLFKAYFSKDGIPSNNGSLTNLDVFVGLKKNAAWREMFIERYVELLCTQLSKERCLEVFDALYNEMKDEMPRQIKRWGYHKSVSDWEKHVKLLRNKLADRPAAALDNLKEYFKLSDAEINRLVAKYS